VNKAGAPPAVFGFGISTPEHVRSALAAGAKGVICGSAIVEKVGLGEDITLLIRSLKAATRERLGAAMNRIAPRRRRIQGGTIDLARADQARLGFDPD
jgi:hypothetical protein